MANINYIQKPSGEEEEIIQKLREYQKSISSTIQKLKCQSQFLIENEIKTKLDINSQFNTLINMINKKKEEVLTDLKDKITKCQSLISAKSQRLQAQQKMAATTMEACQNMMNDRSMDNNVSKYQISSMVGSILKQPPEQALNQYFISFAFNQNAVFPVN